MLQKHAECLGHPVHEYRWTVGPVLSDFKQLNHKSEVPGLPSII